MTETSRPSWLPSVGDILFVLILQLLFSLLPNFLFNDASTGWHLVAGHYVLDHMKVPTTDLISYTFPDKPWVAYEWLFDAIIAGLDKLAGLKLVAVAAGSAIALLSMLLYQDCRKRGCHFLLALVLCIIGAFVSAIHWLVRPHLVTFFGVYLYVRTLDRFWHGEITLKRMLLWLAPVMLIWANCHPAFIMGFAITFIYLACDVFVALCTGKSILHGQSSNRLRGYAAALGVSVLVSLINPYGVQLYHYIFEYLQQTAVISQTDEYKSPVFHGGLQTTCLELLYFALAVGLAASIKKVNLPRLMTVLAYAHLSLSSVRNMPLFVIVALPTIAELLGTSRFLSLVELKRRHVAPEFVEEIANSAPADERNTTPVSEASASSSVNTNVLPESESRGDAMRRPEACPGTTPPSGLLQPFVKLWRSTGATFDETEQLCTRHALPAVSVLLLAISCFSGGKLGGVVLVESDFNPKTVPTENLKRLAALDPNTGFSYDNWGGYICYKTGKRVFIDDRVDFYGQKFYLDYGSIATVQSNWKELLDKYHIKWVLFPANALLTERLRKEPGWKLAGQDDGSCLFVREE